MSFDHLRKLQPDIKTTKPFVFYDIEGEPTIDCLPATEANRPYHNALLRKNAKNARRFRRGKITTQMLEETRDDDRELFARYVCKGWKGIKHSDGTTATFTIEEAQAFFTELPNWIFDELRLWCSESANFVNVPNSADIEETSGN